MLAAPTAPDERLPRVAARARGFVYAVGLLGVTGERSSLAASATALAGRLKAITDRPVLVGVGVSNAEQAREACAVADGVVQGASVVRRLMERGPDAVGAYVAEVRAAIDERHERRDGSGLRAVPGGPLHGVVPRGRRLLDRRVRVVQRADGGVEGPRPATRPTTSRRCSTSGWPP